MTARTHRWLSAAGAAAPCAALNASGASTAVIVGTAYLTASAPDRIEKPLRVDHRTVTHWPLLGVLLAVLVGLGLSSLPDLIEASTEAEGRFLWLVGPITLGFLVSYLTHIAADACTIAGVPLMGPFSRRDRWLLPEPLRIRVHETYLDRYGEKKRRASKGDRAYRLVGMLATVAFLVMGLIDGTLDGITIVR